MSKTTKKRGQPPKTGGSLYYWRTQKEKALAELRASEVAKHRGELLHISEWKDLLARLQGQITVAIDGLDTTGLFRSESLGRHAKERLHWALHAAVSGQPGPEPTPPDKQVPKGHHDWKAWAERNGGSPCDLDDYGFEHGLDSLPTPWFFRSAKDCAGDTVVPDHEREKLRKEWLRTPPGREYLRACEEATERNVRLRAEWEAKHGKDETDDE